MRRIRRRRLGPADVFGQIFGEVADAVERAASRPERLSAYNKEGSVYVDLVFPTGVISHKLTVDELNELADTLERHFSDQSPKDEKE